MDFPPRPLRVLPVLDVCRGAVVRGVAGRRSAYRPWASPLAPSALPAEAAAALSARFGFRAGYLADLDALASGPPQHAVYAAVAAHWPQLWIDAGIAEPAALEQWQRRLGPLAPRPVIGLETLRGPELLAPCAAGAGDAGAVFSLDLRDGVPWARSPAWTGLTPREIGELAVRAGFRTLLVLDVAAVGGRAGPSVLGLLAELRRRCPEVELAAGGGVRDAADLGALAAAGCDVALAATALHEGALTAEDARAAASGAA